MKRSVSHFSIWMIGGIIGFLFIAASVLAQGEVGELFTEAPWGSQFLQEAVPPGREIVRTRYTGVNLRLAERQHPGGRMLLRFFDGAVYTFVADEIQRSNGFLTLIGRAEGVENSLVVVTLGGGQLVADLISPQAIYQVRFVTEDLYAVHQIDQSAYPDEMPPLEATTDDDNAPQAVMDFPAAPAAEDGSRIDVLVLYTALARQQAGGVTAMQNLVNQSVAVTNASYAQSGVLPRLNLVGMSETSYVESGNMILDLDRLRLKTDGSMDNVHTLRDNYKADLVSLFVGNGQYCGVAYQMSSVSAGFADWAFSVILGECAVSNLSFAHELGHNMGARHDWYIDSSSAPFSYSHGHINLSNRWRTIMSYSNYCDNQGVNCTRIQYWSNPGLLYNGVPLGVPAGTCTGSVGCDADNARTLNDSRVTVANFRVSVSPTPTPTPTRTATPTITPTSTQTPTPTPTPTPPYTVLLVDEDDDNPDVRPYYATPLATLRATVTPWSVIGQGKREPDATQMAPYEALIWFTGDDWASPPGPSAATETELIQWLTSTGGCLLITSQEYARFGVNPWPNAFMRDLLGVQSGLIDQRTSKVLGMGDFAGVGEITLQIPPGGYYGNESDMLFPKAGAQIAFMGDEGPAGLYYEGPGFKTAYWGFALEMTPEKERVRILERFLRWCRVWDAFLPLIIR